MAKKFKRKTILGIATCIAVFKGMGLYMQKKKADRERREKQREQRIVYSNGKQSF